MTQATPGSNPAVAMLYPQHQHLYLILSRGRKVNKLIFSQKESVLCKALGNLAAKFNFLSRQRLYKGEERGEELKALTSIYGEFMPHEEF